MAAAHQGDGAIARTRFVLTAGVFFLPLLFWPGIAHPFSSPKLWLLGALDVAAAVLWWSRRWKGESPANVPWQWLLWPATLALSALIAPFASLPALLLAALPLPLCWIAQQDSELAPRLRQALVAGSVAESVLVLLQYSGLDPLSLSGWHGEALSGARMRVYGTLGNPDFVAAWLCATLPLHRPKTRGSWLAVALQLAAIAATGSRVFLLAFPASVLVMAWRRGRLSKWWLAGLPVAAVLLWLSPARPLEVTVQGRLYLARVTVSQPVEVPLLGFGPGSFALPFARWQADWLEQHGRKAAGGFAGEVDHAHNDYLELWVEYGPVGALVFLGLAGWWMARNRRMAGGDAHAGIWAGLAALLAVALVDFPLHRPAEWGLYWLMLGMLGSTPGGPHSAQGPTK